jgi:hypothetical protein
MPYNRMYNELLPPENETMSDLTRTLIGIQMRREEKARQAKLDALMEERQRQQMQMAEDQRQAQTADIMASIAAMGDRPKIDKQVASAGLTDTPPPAPMVQPAMSPEEQMIQDSTGEPTPPMPPTQADLPMTDPQGVPPSIPLTVKEQSPTPTHEFQFGGMTIKRPLYDRGEISALSRQKKLDEGATEITPEMIAGMPEELRPFFKAGSIQTAPNLSATMAAIARKPQGKIVERTVDLGDKTEYIYTDGTREMRPNGPKPSSTSGEKGQWLTRTEDGKRVWVSDEMKRTAPEGMFSDVRPTSTSVRKADPAKLKMAYSALGGPDVKDSLWNLAVTINTDPSMAGAVKGWARDVNAAHNPRAASRMDPTAVKYRSQIMGFASSIAKAFGESGVLTNQDIQRAVNLFPLIGDDPTVTADKLNRVKAVMQAGITSDDFRSIFGRDPSPAEGGGVGGGAASGATGKSVGGFVIEKVQ